MLWVPLSYEGLVPQAGLEPASAANLAQTGYKSAALPVELLGEEEKRVFGASAESPRCERATAIR